MSDAAPREAAPSLSRALGLVALATGTSATLLGLVTTVGWLAHVPGLVQLRSSDAPMVFGTGLCFAFAGLGILARGAGRTTVSRGCGALIAGLVALTLAAYLTDPALGIDQLLGPGWARPVRMAPNTAVAFLLVGLALALPGQGRRSSRALVGGGAAGIAVLSLSTVALVGYAFGIVPAFAWGPTIAMSPQSALGLGLVGVGLVAVVGRPDLMTGLHRQRWLALLAGAAGATTTLLLWQALAADHARTLQSRVDAEARSDLSLGALCGGLLFSGVLALSVHKTIEARLTVLAQRQSENALREAHVTLEGAHLAAAEQARALSLINDQLNREVSERRAAEEERDKFFSLSIDMLCISSRDGYFKRLNPAFELTLGYTVEELTARPFLDFIHPDDVDATLLEVDKQVAQGRRTMHFENRYRCRDGTYRWLAWKSTPDVESGMMYALARDVTNEKRILSKLQASLAEVRTLSEMLPMCSSCRRIRDVEDGSWTQLEHYLSKTKSGTQVSHDMCPECMARLYPDHVRRLAARKSGEKP